MANETEKKQIQLLVVDDNSINVMYLSTMLELSGYKADVSYDAQDALQKIKEIDYHIVFMDLQLPGISGIECARKMRELDLQKGKHSILVAITGYNIKDLENQYNLGDFDELLIKPIFEDQLMEIIKKYLKTN